MASEYAAYHVGDAIRVLREANRISLRKLAAQAGFSPSFISQVENGQASPSIDSLGKIARALGVTLGQFFDDLGGGTAMVTRAPSRKRYSSEWSNATIEWLGSGRALEALLVTFSPGGASGKHEVVLDHEELLYVIDGALTMTLCGDQMLLAAGDTLVIGAGKARMFRNDGSQPARAIVVLQRTDVGAQTGTRSL